MPVKHGSVSKGKRKPCIRYLPGAASHQGFIRTLPQDLSLNIRHGGGNRISRLADWLAAKANRWIPGNPGPKGHDATQAQPEAGHDGVEGYSAALAVFVFSRISARSPPT